MVTNTLHFRADIQRLDRLTTLPETIVAVVGDTGMGKSSLMNALLEHGDILPTSGLRACTSVVVEISNNTVDNQYRAEIEFLAENVSISKEY